MKKNVKESLKCPGQIENILCCRSDLAEGVPCNNKPDMLEEGKFNRTLIVARSLSDKTFLLVQSEFENCKSCSTEYKN